jgi:hypothetical protein
MSARRAVLLGISAGFVLGFVFGIRAGLVSAPAVALICGLGISVTTLTVTAGILLGLVVPVIYLVDLPPSVFGFDVSYALDLVDAHWVAVAAVVLLLVALARALIDIRSARRSTA